MDKLLLGSAIAAVLGFFILRFASTFEGKYKIATIVVGVCCLCGGIYSLANAGTSVIVPCMLLFFSGGLLIGGPIRTIVTEAVLEKCKDEAAQDLNGQRQEMIQKYHQVMAELEAQKKNLEKKEQEILQQEKELETQRNTLARRSEELGSAYAVYEKRNSLLRTQIAAYNASIAAADAIYYKQNKQIEILSRSNERLKGTLGRLTPYKDAWNHIVARASDDRARAMHQVLREKQMASKSKRDGSRHSPRELIAAPQAIENVTDEN